MVDEVLHAVVFGDVEVPGVAGRVPASFRGILHYDQPGRASSHRQFLHTFVGHRSTLVPVGMERKDQPIVIVDESRFDFVLQAVWMDAALRLDVSDLDRLTVIVFSLVSEFISYML